MATHIETRLGIVGGRRGAFRRRRLGGRGQNDRTSRRYGRGWIVRPRDDYRRDAFDRDRGDHVVGRRELSTSRQPSLHDANATCMILMRDSKTVPGFRVRLTNEHKDTRTVSPTGLGTDRNQLGINDATVR